MLDVDALVLDAALRRFGSYVRAVTVKSIGTDEHGDVEIEAAVHLRVEVVNVHVAIVPPDS